jgi:hypothetical protein
MATFKEAEARLFENMYVDKKKEQKIRLQIGKVLAGKASVRKGMSKRVRLKRKISKSS